MTACVWLHDSAGAWVADLKGDDGNLIADMAHVVGCTAPTDATVRMAGEIERGVSLTTIHPTWWTVAND